MKAQEYLEARGLKVTLLKNVSVGRLSIGAEFKIAGKRGVVVSPKRGSVSDRYLSLLSKDGVSFVVAEGGSTLSFYETLEKGKELVAVRALRPTKSHSFPALEVLEYLSSLLRQAVKKREFVGQIASNIALLRITDEKSGRLGEWNSSVSDSVEDCALLLNRITDQIKNTNVDSEGILKVCAIIAGFRITPETQKESILLLDWVAQLSDSRRIIHGMSLALSPVFQVIGKKAQAVSIVTTAIGAQFSALSGKSNDTIIIENGSHGALSLLKALYPNARFSTENYLEYQDDKFTDTVIIIPPFGRSLSLKPETAFAGSFFKDKTTSKKIPAEYLYIFKAIEQCQPNGIVVAVVPEGLLSGASHASFRNWLLDKMQILGVVSVPAGFCFSGTAVRCSILFLKKTEEIPADYSISMIELHPQDFEESVASSAVQAIQGILTPEDHT
ncbi:MAG TPA: hypothetical protein ENG51_14920 [Deltaproteobacteria bacterium]|nr:hypothetical protein [Deltaproteobacteria bacterium]